MQDVDSFCKLRQIEDPVLYAGMDSQLLDTRPYAGHGLPVVRLKPLLNQMQLMTGKAPGVLWERPQILKS